MHLTLSRAFAATVLAAAFCAAPQAAKAQIRIVSESTPASLSAAGFKTEKRVFPNQTHSSVVVPAAMDGLPFLLPPQTQ